MIDPIFSKVLNVCNPHIVVLCEQHSCKNFPCVTKKQKHKQTLPHVQCIQQIWIAECFSIFITGVLESFPSFDEVSMPSLGWKVSQGMSGQYVATVHPYTPTHAKPKNWRWISLYGACAGMAACSFALLICTLHIKSLRKMCWIFQVA